MQLSFSSSAKRTDQNQNQGGGKELKGKIMFDFSPWELSKIEKKRGKRNSGEG